MAPALARDAARSKTVSNVQWAPVILLATLAMVLPGGPSWQSSSHAGQVIPIRRVTMPSAHTVERLGAVAGLRELTDGGILVNDTAGHRLVVFRARLDSCFSIADSSGNSGQRYPRSAFAGLYAYSGDSTLFPDVNTRTLLVIDPHGQVARVMAHPRDRDFAYLSQTTSGVPGIDSQQRLIYLGGPHESSKISERDTIQLIRASFQTRSVDTVAAVTRPRIMPLKISTGPDGRIHGIQTINPVPGGVDNWAVLSDGAIAIVRAYDYHIDWILPDGTRMTTPRMSFDWRRLTEDAKRARIDSIVALVDSMSAAGHPFGLKTIATRGQDGKARVDTVVPQVEFIPLELVADYIPPVRNGAVKPDLDQHLWILPTTSRLSGDGLVYDVVNEAGIIIERVQLPPGRELGGFGRGGVLYLIAHDKRAGVFVERVSMSRDGDR